MRRDTAGRFAAGDTRRDDAGQVVHYPGGIEQHPLVEVPMQGVRRRFAPRDASRDVSTTPGGTQHWPGGGQQEPLV